MRKLAFALVLAALATPAAAEVAQRRPFTPTGNLVKDVGDALKGGSDAQEGATRQRILQTLAKPFQDIQQFIGEGVDGAIELSTAIPDLQDGHGQQCWIALRNFTAVGKAHPLPLTGHLAIDLEALRLYAIAANRLCSDVHCTQMFNDYVAMGQSIAQAAVGAIGAVGAKAFTPSLQDACTKIPQIPLIAPITPVPPAPDVKPVGLGDTAAPPK